MSSMGSRVRRVAKMVALAQDELSALQAEVVALENDLAWPKTLEAVRKAHETLYELGNVLDQRDEAELESRHGHYTDDELRYSAGARCPCGAGLAYHKRTGIRGAWECSDLLTGRAVAGEKEHTEPLPFAFYEVKSEDQPSAGGRTTRPKES